MFVISFFVLSLVLLFVCFYTKDHKKSIAVGWLGIAFRWPSSSVDLRVYDHAGLSRHLHS